MVPDFNRLEGNDNPYPNSSKVLTGDIFFAMYQIVPVTKPDVYASVNILSTRINPKIPYLTSLKSWDLRIYCCLLFSLSGLNLNKKGLKNIVLKKIN